MYNVIRKANRVLTNTHGHLCFLIYILYRGKLSREKTFTQKTQLWLFAKVFSVKVGGVVSFGVAQASNLRKFSPLKVSRYTVGPFLHQKVITHSLTPTWPVVVVYHSRTGAV